MVSIIELGMWTLIDLKPVSLQFPSVSRGAARAGWPRTESIPNANTADAIFEQIHLIIDNSNFHIRVILNPIPHIQKET